MDGVRAKRCDVALEEDVSCWRRMYMLYCTMCLWFTRIFNHIATTLQGVQILCLYFGIVLKSYLYNPAISVPQRTAWRQQKHCSDNSTTVVAKKRKIYYCKPNSAVPKTTLWRWTKHADEELGESEHDGNEETIEGCNEEVRKGSNEKLDGVDGVNNSGSECSIVERIEDEYECIESDTDTSESVKEGNEEDIECLFSDEVGDVSSRGKQEDCTSSDEVNEDYGSGEEESSDSESYNTYFSDEINDECDDDEPENFEESNDNGSSEQCCSNSESYNHLDISYQQPLYENAPITLEESIYSTYLFSVKNKLSYNATSQLVQLM